MPESQEQMAWLDEWAKEEAKKVEQRYPGRMVTNITINKKDITINLSPVKRDQ